MKTIHVPTAVPYDVQIGPGLLSTLGDAIRQTCPRATRVVLVTDDGVHQHWAGPAVESLKKAGLTGAVRILPRGEQSKTAQRLIELLNFATSCEMTRSDVFVALGGGMVGDITGLAAATYMRGVAYIQIPTTLLAAVDSSVGGKTAVDLPAGKNLMGAFWQPALVLCDTEVLKTLPRSVFIAGCAEVVKYATLFDQDLFAQLEQSGLAFDREEVIARCVAHKRDVVAEDERDTGRRALLNLGHTLGHAVEASSDYILSHGQSVSIGMATVARAAAAKGICDPSVPDRLSALLGKFGLPIFTDASLEKIMPLMLTDKKRSGDTVNVIVPERIGSCAVRPMDAQALYEFMKAGL